MSAQAAPSRPKLARAFGRITLKISRLFLAPIEAIRPRLYMRIYAKLLARYGMRFNGPPRYISSSAYFDDLDLITLGARAVISRNVIFLTHDYSLTTALIAIGEPPLSDVSLNQEIRLGQNVFVGMNAIILPGTTVGDNVVIAAGSVVRGSLPDDGIYAGNPVRRISGVVDRAQEWIARRDGVFAAHDRA